MDNTFVCILAQQHVGWTNLGSLPVKNPPHSHAQTQPAHRAAQALFQKLPCWLGQSARLLSSRPPSVWHYEWKLCVRSLDPRPPSTTVMVKAPVKLLWHEEAKGTLEVLTQSERKSDTCTHACAHWHDETCGVWACMWAVLCFSSDCLVIISVSGLFHVSA